MKVPPFRIASPWTVAPAAPAAPSVTGSSTAPASSPAKGSSPAAAASSATAPAGAPPAPIDLPPELRIQVPPPPDPEVRGWRRFAVPVALAASLVGVAGPIFADLRHAAAITAEVKARQEALPLVTAQAQLAATRFPAPEVVASTEAGGPRISPDGRALLLPSPSRDGGATLVRTDDGRAAGRLDAFRGATFLPDSRVLTWGQDGVAVRSAENGKVEATVAGRPEYVSVAPAAARAAWLEQDGLHVLDATGPQAQARVVQLEAGTREAHVAAWSGDGSRLAVMASTGYEGPARLTVIDARDGQVLSRTEVHPRVRTVSLSRDGRYVGVGRASDYGSSRWSGRVSVLDAASGRTLWDRNGADVIAFDPASDRAALYGVGDGVAYVEVADAASGREAFSLQAPSVSGYSASGGLQFTPDGRRLVVSSGLSLQVFDAASGQALWGHRSVEPILYTVSPDGARVAMSEYAGSSGQGHRVVTVVDAADGRVVTQEPLEGTVAAPQFGAGSARLLTPSSQAYYVSSATVLDLTRSPRGPQEAAAAREEARALVESLTSGPAAASHRALDGLPVSVLRVLQQQGTHVHVVPADGDPSSLVRTVDPASRWADRGELGSLAERAFREADSQHGKRIADAEARLQEAREAARQKGGGRTLGGIAPPGFDATLLDSGVQSAAYELWSARQARAIQAWTTIEGAAGGRLEAAGSNGRGFDGSRRTTEATTLEGLARAHGARSADEVRQFTDLVRSLNGPKLEQAQARYYESVRALYPTDGPSRLPVEQRPFVPDHADLVVPSLWYDGGRAIAGRDHAALEAWRAGGPAAVFERADGGRTLALRDADGVDRAAVLTEVGRAYDAALAKADPQFHARSMARWTDHVGRDWRADTRVAPDEAAARAFAGVTGPDREVYVRDNAVAAGFVKAAIDAAGSR